VILSSLQLPPVPGNDFADDTKVSTDTFAQWIPSNSSGLLIFASLLQKQPSARTNMELCFIRSAADAMDECYVENRKA